jgi:hypothetical protein
MYPEATAQLVSKRGQATCRSLLTAVVPQLRSQLHQAHSVQTQGLGGCQPMCSYQRWWKQHVER